MSRHSQLLRSRRYLVVAIVLVAVVIIVSTVAQSSVPKWLVQAQRNYLSDVTPVETADVIFNGGASTPPNHSATSTRTLELALGKEFNELHEQKWPQVAAANVAQLAQYTHSEYLLLLSFNRSPSSKRSVILDLQQTLLGDIENANFNILKELRLPLPISVSQHTGPPKKVP